MIDLTDLIRDFAGLLNPHESNAERLDQWITTARAADLPQLHAFTRGLDQDWDAVRAALTLPYHNGGTEGVNTKNESCAKCTAEQDFPCYATESYSADHLTQHHHRIWDRAELETEPKTLQTPAAARSLAV